MDSCRERDWFQLSARIVRVKESKNETNRVISCSGVGKYPMGTNMHNNPVQSSSCEKMVDDASGMQCAKQLSALKQLLEASNIYAWQRHDKYVLPWIVAFFLYRKAYRVNATSSSFGISTRDKECSKITLEDDLARVLEGATSSSVCGNEEEFR